MTSVIGPYGVNCFARETVTADTTPASPVATIPLGKRLRSALITADGDVRVTFDGTAPSATVGHKMADGDTLVVLNEGAVRALRFFAAAPIAVQVSLFEG